MKMKNVLKVPINIFKNQIYKYRVKDLKILSSDETIDNIIKNNLSVCRFGDGEMFIIDNESGCGFQDIDNELSDRLLKVFNDTDNRKILICIPKWMFDKKELNLRTSRSQKWCRRYLLYHFGTWCNKVNLNYTYGDTSFNRRYISTKDKSNSRTCFENLKSIWKDRDICFVEGEKTRLGIGNDLFDNAKSIKRIIAPSENAFGKISQIEDVCKKMPKGTLFLIALGPTATVLCHDLSNFGFQAIDIGHIDIEYEWFLMGAVEPVPLKNKYVNEVQNKIDDCNFINEKYNSEVIERVL